MQKQLINKKGLFVDGLKKDNTQTSECSQSSNSLAFAFDIVPEKNKHQVIEHIKSLSMSQGMVTLPWLIRAIRKSREGEHLFELLTNKEWNGWARCIEKGAIATWESWDADETGQSQSHAWGSSGLEAYVRYILGIRPLKPQFKKLLIHPLDFGDKIAWVKGRISTKRGTIEVNWKREKDNYEIQFSIPINTQADVCIPNSYPSSKTLLLNGKPTTAKRSGNYLKLLNIGSGKYTISSQN